MEKILLKALMEQTKSQNTTTEDYMKFSIEVLRLHQKWGWLSNVMDFYQNNEKYDAWWETYQKENGEFLSSDDEKERQIQELENTINDKFY